MAMEITPEDRARFNQLIKTNNQKAANSRAVSNVVNRIHELSTDDIQRLDLALQQRLDRERIKRCLNTQLAGENISAMANQR